MMHDFGAWFFFGDTGVNSPCALLGVATCGGWARMAWERWSR